MKNTEEKNSLARKYRDRLAECPVNPEKHPQILGEMMLEMSMWSRSLRQMSVWFPDRTHLEIRFDKDGTLVGQTLQEQEFDSELEALEKKIEEQEDGRSK